MSSESLNIKNRYKKRPIVLDQKYSRTNFDVLYSAQERHRALIRFLRSDCRFDLSTSQILDVGCGSGVNLLDLITFGAKPQNLCGVDILSDRLAVASQLLPSSVNLIEGDISDLQLNESSFDLIHISLVFSSVLDVGHRSKMASNIWSLLKPGGCLLCYDFIYNNPSNFDVRGIQLPEIRRLFPHGIIQSQKITLAPPIARRVSKVSPYLCVFFNFFPFLRTHLLCKIVKK